MSEGAEFLTEQTLSDAQHTHLLGEPSEHTYVASTQLKKERDRGCWPLNKFSHGKSDSYVLSLRQSVQKLFVTSEHTRALQGFLGSNLGCSLGMGPWAARAILQTPKQRPGAVTVTAGGQLSPNARVLTMSFLSSTAEGKKRERERGPMWGLSTVLGRGVRVAWPAAKSQEGERWHEQGIWLERNVE